MIFSPSKHHDVGPPIMLKQYRKSLKSHHQLNAISSGLDFKFTTHHNKNKRDLLASLCDKYGSDKGELKSAGHPYPWPSHTFSDFYSRLFGHCRAHVKRVFECGLGTNNPNLASSMGAAGKPGASLRVWRDYFQNAVVFGADIDRDVLFEEERIKTFFINQLDPTAISEFWRMVGVGDFDFMIDDGLHTYEAGSTLFTNSIPHLASHGIYVIEDVGLADLLKYMEFFEKTDYLVDYVTMFRPNAELNNNNLVVIRQN